MSCGKDAKKCTSTAQGQGAPEITATWAEGRDGGGHCPECGGFLTTEGVCNNDHSRGTFAMSMAGDTESQDIIVRDLWRGEFRSGMDITLQNGETLKSGQRFTDEKYLATLGKKKAEARVGRTLTMAVDGMQDWENPEAREDGNWAVTMVDGTKAFYDPDTMATVCDKGCVGMCHHQMAALLVGEAIGSYPAEAGTTREQLMDTLVAPRLKNKAYKLSTVEAVKASDAAYAFLADKLNGDKVLTGEGSLLPVPEPEPEPEPPKPKKKPPKKKKKPAKTAMSAVTGNKAVNKLMETLGVVPPLPTAQYRLAQGDESYEGNPVPLSDPRYELDGATKQIMTSIIRRTNLSWRAAERRVEAQGGDLSNIRAYSGSMEDRTWGLYGPPGTGKNSMGRETAASLGLGYMEVDVHNRTDFQSLLADTVIESDGEGGTNTTARLGAVGKALVEGNVVAINEIVAADPDAQTALHQVVQDGIIRAPGPEGANKYWKVHPNSVLFLTWNPNTAREDKPGAALLSRTPSYKMDYPKPQDEAKRVSTAMSDYFGETVPPKKVKRAVNLVRGLRELYEQGELESPPTYRELQSFTKEWLLNGENPIKAAELFRVLCSQGADHEDQWKQIKRFASGFQEGTWKL